MGGQITCGQRILQQMRRGSCLWNRSPPPHFRLCQQLWHLQKWVKLFYFRYTDHDLINIILNNFDLRAGCIVRDLNLKRPIYSKTTAYGHFGRNEPEFTWE
jgi:hypothetical protein